MIPIVGIAALFGPPLPARNAADTAIKQAAADIGFMTITGFPGGDLLTPAARARLLRIFALPDAEKAKLLRWAFDPSRPNVYRGWFPLQNGFPSHKEGIDMGPDVAHGANRVDASDPLREATPLPPEALLPGWRAAVADHYLAMERIGAALMRAIARGLDLPETTFDAAFEGGNSSLRLARYPIRTPTSLKGADPAALQVTVDGTRRWLTNVEHVDSGFVTLLAQDGVSGLQAQARDGRWVDVPPTEGTLAVNFGKVLERWTGGRIRATAHRVIAPERERFSIPFFYEPRIDAEIAPLPLPDVAAFEPFLYGDHLWAATTKFVEQRGIAHLRPPRRT